MAVTLSTFGAAPAQQAPPIVEPIATPDPATTPSATPTLAAEPAATPVPTPAAEPTPSSNGVATPTDDITDTSEFELNIPGQEPAPVATPAGTPPAAATTTPAATAAIDLDTILGTADKKEVLKKLGISDFAIELNDHLSRGGNAADYLSAKAINWNEVPDEDIVKSKLREQYPNFSKEEIQRMFDRKYDGGITEEDKEDALLQLKADAYSERQARIQRQQQFKLPEAIMPPSKDEQYENWKQATQEQQTLVKEMVSFYNDHPATKSLNESKRVTINLGDGIKPFNFTVSKPELITRALTDDGTIMRQLTSTETGEPDVQKSQLMALFAFNPQGFIQSIFNYGMQQGVHKKLVGEGQNAIRPGQNAGQMQADVKPTYGTGKFADKPRS